MKKYFLTGIAIATFIFFLNSCIKFEKKSSITNFSVITESTTVPATVKVIYSFEVKNTCIDLVLTYYGSDSIRSLIYNESNPDEINDYNFIKVEESELTRENCTQGGVGSFDMIHEFQYLNPGEYKIEITLAEETQTKEFSLISP